MIPFTEEHKRRLSIARARQIIKHTIETRRKMSLSSIGKKKSPEHIENIRKVLLGRKLTETHKNNISLSLKGHIISQETKDKIGKANRISLRGHKPTTEATNKAVNSRRLSAIQRGYWFTQEAKDKIRRGNINTNIGTKQSKEVKDKKNNNIRVFWKNHPEMKNQVSIRTKKQRQWQVFPIRDTSIEVKIQSFLKRLDLDFFTHQYIKEIEHGYQCDILIPSMNLVIECDGNYWHKYPTGTELDRIRTEELLEKGFKVLRLWESEINKITLDDFKKLLNKFDINFLILK